MKTKKINGKQYVAIDAVSEHEISGNLIESKKHKLWLDASQLGDALMGIPVNIDWERVEKLTPLILKRNVKPGDNPEATS